LRNSKRWTQGVLGRLCGVKSPQISKLERGRWSSSELRLLKIADLFDCELRLVDKTASQTQKLWLHPERDEAYRTTIRGLLSAHTVQRIDLLQFSGFTAIPVLETVANHSPDVHIRLLLAAPELAALYGWNQSQDFHQRRRDSTIGHCNMIMQDVMKKKQDAQLAIDIWHYSVPPTFSGIIVDDWLVSVGWYWLFATTDSPTGTAILGHKLPALTVIEEQAQPFIAMVRDQITALIALRKPDHSLHPPV
jgi:transcriptional regulator with XRE-family HTH domain